MVMAVVSPSGPPRVDPPFVTGRPIGGARRAPTGRWTKEQRLFHKSDVLTVHRSAPPATPAAQRPVPAVPRFAPSVRPGAPQRVSREADSTPLPCADATR